MSTAEVPPKAESPIEIPIKQEITVPVVDLPKPTTIHFRVLIHGEVDIDVPSNTDLDQLARLIAKDIISKYPTFKITRLLKAIGTGPVGETI